MQVGIDMFDREVWSVFQDPNKPNLVIQLQAIHRLTLGSRIILA